MLNFLFFITGFGQQGTNPKKRDKCLSASSHSTITKTCSFACFFVTDFGQQGTNPKKRDKCLSASNHSTITKTCSISYFLSQVLASKALNYLIQRIFNNPFGSNPGKPRDKIPNHINSNNGLNRIPFSIIKPRNGWRIKAW